MFLQLLPQSLYEIKPPFMLHNPTVIVVTFQRDSLYIKDCDVTVHVTATITAIII